MKPKPFSALNHFTVPCATCAPTFRACGRSLWIGGPRSRSSARRTRTWNSNRARRYMRVARVTPTPRSADARMWGGLPHPPGKDPTLRLRDESRRPDRAQRGLHAVGRPDHRLERVEGLEALPRVEDDGLL